jgi:predicted dehydrogenase
VLRIGIIGAGPNGAGHARYYHACACCEVIAIADPDAQRARTLAVEVSAQPTADYRGFLDDVDAVVVSSPNHLHAEHAAVCAAAGKHVYCEKPMGLSAAEGERVHSAVCTAGVRSVVGFSVRFSPVVQTMLRMISEGEVGPPISVWSRRLGPGPPQGGGWRADQARSGGVLMEIGVHELDWLLAAGGEPVSVFARMCAADGARAPANDHVWATIAFRSGAAATLETGWLSPVPDYYRGVFGTLGGAATQDWGRSLLRGLGGGKTEPADLADAVDLRAHFLDCIERGAEPLADSAWGLRVMKLADALVRSAASGAVERIEETREG